MTQEIRSDDNTMGLGTEEIVARRVSALQRDYLGSNESRRAQARRDLANLRRAINHEPGIDPEIWHLTIRDIKDAVDEQPSFEQKAAHLGLTLYAIHQQSHQDRMHIPKVEFGRAVARLELTKPSKPGRPSPVRRRFDAAATSSSISELAHHLRGLIVLLGRAGIGFDYGSLTKELLLFQRPGGDKIVRRSWGCQFYRELDLAERESSTTEQGDTRDKHLRGRAHTADRTAE